MVDVVSTSNMFQVGIDIGRLGLMDIMDNQEATLSTYNPVEGSVENIHKHGSIPTKRKLP